MRWQKNEQIASIPMRTVGPLAIASLEVNESVYLPLATFETPLWASTHRGATVCNRAGGIKATIVDDRMTRSVLLEAADASTVHQAYLAIQSRQSELKELIAKTSRFAALINLNAQMVGSLLFLRLEFLTGDASGHNMVTLAAEHILQWITREYPQLHYVSISGNLCSDKKTSAVNGLLGRGKNVITEVVLPRDICQKYLHTTPEKIVALNIKKNLIGSIVSGGLRTANAHVANMLLAFYLATGQDAANIVEGSQAIVYADVRDDALYFSLTLPNIIVGTVGNGKTHGFVKENLALLGCDAPREVGVNARRLAIIAAASVLCGELSLLAAQTNEGELMKSHIKLERQNKKELLP